MLTRENLKGVFAAVPIPWDEEGGFAEATFREDVARLCETGIDGIYTTGSTGEFYSLDFDEFKQMVDAFVAETRYHKVLTQIGCTWVNSTEAARRASYAARKGADGIQVALPFWTPLNDRETIAFFKEMAEASGDLPMIHYNTARSKKVLGAREYRMILSEVPALIGTKFTGSDLSALTALLFKLPEIAHFVGEILLVPGMMLGAKGCYSSMVLMNPRLVLSLYRACKQGEWDQAILWQRKVSRYFAEAIEPLLEEGYVDAAIDKAMVAVTKFLKCHPRVRTPYSGVSDAQIDALRRYLEQNLPEFLQLDGQVRC